MGGLGDPQGLAQARMRATAIVIYMVQWRIDDVVVTRGAMGSLRETFEGFGLVGAFALELGEQRFGWLRV